MIEQEGEVLIVDEEERPGRRHGDYRVRLTELGTLEISGRDAERGDEKRRERKRAAIDPNKKHKTKKTKKPKALEKQVTAEDLACPICYNVMIDPVTLTCGHNGCQACVKTYVDGLVNRELPMKCPVGCQTEQAAVVPPVNLTLRSCIEVIAPHTVQQRRTEMEEDAESHPSTASRPPRRRRSCECNFVGFARAVALILLLAALCGLVWWCLIELPATRPVVIHIPTSSFAPSPVVSASSTSSTSSPSSVLPPASKTPAASTELAAQYALRGHHKPLFMRVPADAQVYVLGVNGHIVNPARVGTNFKHSSVTTDAIPTSWEQSQSDDLVIMDKLPVEGGSIRPVVIVIGGVCALLAWCQVKVPR